MVVVRRRDEVATMAAEQELQFYPAKLPSLLGSLFSDIDETYPCYELITLLQDFDPIRQGTIDSAANFVVGESPHGTFYAMDYKRRPAKRNPLRLPEIGIAALRLPINLEPIDFQFFFDFDMTRSLLGMPRVLFECAEFNEHCHVSCQDRKFAFDLVHPELIDFLMPEPFTRLQIIGPLVVATQEGYFTAGELVEVRRNLERFVELIPEYLWQDRGFDATWKDSFTLERQ
jgi:hypothetical protein